MRRVRYATPSEYRPQYPVCVGSGQFDGCLLLPFRGCFTRGGERVDQCFDGAFLAFGSGWMIAFGHGWLLRTSKNGSRTTCFRASGHSSTGLLSTFEFDAQCGHQSRQSRQSPVTPVTYRSGGPGVDGPMDQGVSPDSGTVASAAGRVPKSVSRSRVRVCTVLYSSLHSAMSVRPGKNRGRPHSVGRLLSHSIIRANYSSTVSSRPPKNTAKTTTTTVKASL